MKSVTALFAIITMHIVLVLTAAAIGFGLDWAIDKLMDRPEAPPSYMFGVLFGALFGSVFGQVLGVFMRERHDLD